MKGLRLHRLLFFKGEGKKFFCLIFLFITLNELFSSLEGLKIKRMSLFYYGVDLVLLIRIFQSFDYFLLRY